MEFKKLKEKKEKRVSSFYKNYFIESNLHKDSREKMKLKLNKFKNKISKKQKQIITDKNLTKKVKK
tara:strand:- start:534 stop:731 length:198 start_codon:yes stop_codon:yes gene_type:complete